VAEADEEWEESEVRKQARVLRKARSGAHGSVYGSVLSIERS